jgi:protein-tyrosine-phosphatase
MVDTAALAREPGLALDLFKLAQLAWNAHGTSSSGHAASQLAAPQLTSAAILSLCDATAVVLRALLPSSDPLLADLANMQRILRSAISDPDSGSARSPRLRGRP